MAPQVGFPQELNVKQSLNYANIMSYGVVLYSERQGSGALWCC